MAVTLMMTVSTFIPPSDFATHKKRLLEILTVQNLNNKNLGDIMQNLKGLLCLNDILDEHLCMSTKPTHHMHIICKRLVECWGLDIVPTR